MHRYGRPVAMLARIGLPGSLAITGNKEAITAVISACGLLCGATWGERAALKVPGKDT